MNWKNEEPVLVKNESKFEALPIDPSLKDILDKVLEQNKMILEQNAKIIGVLSPPMFIVSNNDAS